MFGISAICGIDPDVEPLAKFVANFKVVNHDCELMGISATPCKSSLVNSNEMQNLKI